MDFGLHFLLSCARHQSPAQRYRDSLEQALRAEVLGFESVWPVEHHFQAEISIMPCPNLFLAAVAARTERLRLGTAIAQLPLTHPLRVAEEFACLDVLSGGRAELGVGPGGHAAHYAGFGVPRAERRARFGEGVALLQRALSGERFSFQGRFYQVDGAALAPAPLQRPTPSLRVAVTSEETAAFAGTEGLPIMIATHVNPLPRLRMLLASYAAARHDAGHGPYAPDDLTLLMPLFVSESAAAAREDVAPNIEHYRAQVSALARAALSKCTIDAERTELLLLIERAANLSFEQINDGMGCFGTPKQCRDLLTCLERDFNPGRVIAWFNVGGLLPHHAVLRSMELFARDVMPWFVGV